MGDNALYNSTSDFINNPLKRKLITHRNKYRKSRSRYLLFLKKKIKFMPNLQNLKEKKAQLL